MFLVIPKVFLVAPRGAILKCLFVADSVEKVASQKS